MSVTFICSCPYDENIDGHYARDVAHHEKAQGRVHGHRRLRSRTRGSSHTPPPPPHPHPHPHPQGHQSCERGSGSRKSHRHNTVLLLDMAVNDIHISGTMSMWNLNIFMIWWRICKINNRGADSANVCPEFCQVRLFQIVCVLLNVVHEHCCFV